MFDLEKLIIEVEVRLCLWNAGDKSYSDKFSKQKAWHEIGESCIEEWNTLTSAEKQDKVEFLQKKWKSIRDYYIREKKKDKEDRGGSAANKKKKNPYFSMLQFLDTSKEPRQCSTNSTESSDSPADPIEELTFSDNIDIEVEYLIKQEQEDTLETSTTLKTLAPQTSTPKPPLNQVVQHRKRKMTPFQESLLQSFTQKNDDDPNKFFLLSFLPEMAKMTERQNFEFRMEMMKALNKVKYQIPDSTHFQWSEFTSSPPGSYNSNT